MSSHNGPSSRLLVMVSPAAENRLPPRYSTLPTPCSLFAYPPPRCPSHHSSSRVLPSKVFLARRPALLLSLLLLLFSFLSLSSILVHCRFSYPPITFLHSLSRPSPLSLLHSITQSAPSCLPNHPSPPPPSSL